MPRAVDLLKQGRNEDLWQMCCGFLSLSMSDFMGIQNRLLEEQLELLNNCALGEKIMKGARPQTVEEFRKQVPLTSYKDYADDFMEKREDILPVKPAFWVRTSGRSGDYPCKWVPMTPEYAQQLSVTLYGIGMLSCARGWDDTSQIPDNIKLLYGVAPRPYISGTFADLLRRQSPFVYLPTLEEAETLSFEDRMSKGFQRALYEGLDFFFGISLVLVKVGEKLRDSSNKIDIRPYILKPRALWRLSKGLVKSKLAGRALLPKDIWSIKGIIGSGVDSWIYKDKIKELWGKNALDIYSSTEGGVIATQAWDYDGMTFIPNLNFYEFIPEEENLKWEMDRSYKPKTLLLDEVKAGETYELVLTNFHGGAMVRYRIGDVVRITALRNEKLGIEIPQMAFERRADDLLNFMIIKLNEKQIWQSIEKAGILYEDWVAYKIPGEAVLHVLIEPKNGFNESSAEMANSIGKYLIDSGTSSYTASGVPEDWRNALDFNIDVTVLPEGTFARYTSQKQAEGADLAHIKPPHINPSDKVLEVLLGETEEITVVKTGVKAETGTETAQIT